MNHFEMFGISADHIVHVSADGTSTNVGHKTGAIVYLQQFLARTLMVTVCLIHHAELPYRALFTFFDGTTQGPNVFKGPIGKAISTDVWLLPVTDFTPIFCRDFPEIDSDVLRNMSHDLQYLFAICEALNKGVVNEALAHQKIGALSTARWYTFASRLARYYIAGAHPDTRRNVRRVLYYIVNVYVKVHLDIKKRPLIADAPKHLFQEMIRIQETCTDEEKEVVMARVRYNAHFAHPEHILYSLICEEDEDLVNEGIRLIKAVRRGWENYTGRKNPIRVHVVPKINEDAAKYQDLFQFVTVDNDPRKHFEDKSGKVHPVYEPVPVKGVPDDDLEEFIRGGHHKRQYTSHTQQVERAVALTSDVVSNFSDYNRQLGRIFMTERARQNEANEKLEEQSNGSGIGKRKIRARSKTPNRKKRVF